MNLRRLVSLLLPIIMLSGNLAADDAQIRIEVEKMAHDFLNNEMIEPFNHDMSIEKAYAWQDVMVDLLQPTYGDLAGYKTGGHNPGGTSNFPAGGIRAQMLEGMFHGSGLSIKPGDTKAGFLEADFALRVGNSGINTAKTDLEILAGLDAFIPFAEIPDPYAKPDTVPFVKGIITNMSSRVAITGEPVYLEPTQKWLDTLNNFDFAVLNEHDEIIARGSMAEWYQPIKVVRWVRDHLLASGKELKPGQIISLGNIGINRALHPNTPRGPVYKYNQYRVEYYGLKNDGPATVTINIKR